LDHDDKRQACRCRGPLDQSPAGTARKLCENGRGFDRPPGLSSIERGASHRASTINQLIHLATLGGYPVRKRVA
jgi:hypothetical protein